MDLYDQMARFADQTVGRGVYDVDAPQFDTNPQPFLETLEEAGLGVVVEVRVPEPSMGRIPKDLDVKRNVREMLRRGADAVGVMTEQMKFGGNLDLVGQARQGAPVAMRDFVVDPVQVQAAHHAGASAVTLHQILHDRGHADLDELVEAAREWDLEAIVLVHSAEEAEDALAWDADALGLVVQDPVTHETRDGLLEAIPEVDAGVPILVVGGIRDHDDLVRAREAGATGVWIDGPLVKTKTPWMVVEDIVQPEDAAAD